MCVQKTSAVKCACFFDNQHQALNTEFHLDQRLWTIICTHTKCDMTMMSLSPPTDCTAALSGFIQKYCYFHANTLQSAHTMHGRTRTTATKNMTSTCDNSGEKNSVEKTGDIKWAASNCVNGDPGAFHRDFCMRRKCLQVNKHTNKENKYDSTTVAINASIYHVVYL